MEDLIGEAQKLDHFCVLDGIQRYKEESEAHSYLSDVDGGHVEPSNGDYFEVFLQVFREAAVFQILRVLFTTDGNWPRLDRSLQVGKIFDLRDKTEVGSELEWVAGERRDGRVAFYESGDCSRLAWVGQFTRRLMVFQARTE